MDSNNAPLNHSGKESHPGWVASFVHAPTTIRLLVCSGVLFVLAGLLMRPVSVLRPVLTETGEQVRRSDGQPVRERDRIGQFRVNWDAYSCLIGSAVLLGWALVREAWKARHVRTSKQDVEDPPFHQ
jgi:hypothetical protein